jgi:hypothetical protein
MKPDRPGQLDRRNLLAFGASAGTLAILESAGLIRRPSPARAEPAWYHPFTFRSSYSNTYYTTGYNGEPGYHRALDYTPGAGVPVYSVASGTVVEVIYDNGTDVPWQGNHVRIDHGDSWWSSYSHLANPPAVGGWLEASTLLGHVGNTGESYGAHLHLEIWHGGNDRAYRVDPMDYVHHPPVPLALAIPPVGIIDSEEEYFVDSGYYIRNASWNISWYSRVTGKRRALQPVEWTMLVAEYGGNSANVPLVVMSNADFAALPAYV